MAGRIAGAPRPGSRVSARPLLYLDVDGVLNPENPRDPGRFAEHAVGRLTVRVSDEHAEWLVRLRGTYDLVWATTWEGYANEYIAPLLGLPELPYVDFSGYRARPDDPKCPPLLIPQMRKWAPILRHADGRRFAWVDDVMPMRVRRQAFLHRGMLLVKVRPGDGLRWRHVDRLLRWGVSRS
ncbi:HAD domain-containing protein [Actinomadura miaoliensis]|uniref:HAD domain-containing protein n=1 Tax=Actinomadura miaoliensis TaxID=430685 RepID=UPI0031E9DD80